MAQIFPSMRSRKTSKEMLPERAPEAAEENTNSVEETRDYVIPSPWAPCGTQIKGCGDREQASSAAWFPPDFVAEIPREMNSWRKSSRRAASIPLKWTSFLQPLRMHLHQALQQETLNGVSCFITSPPSPWCSLWSGEVCRCCEKGQSLAFHSQAILTVLDECRD